MGHCFQLDTFILTRTWQIPKKLVWKRPKSIYILLHSSPFYIGFEWVNDKYHHNLWLRIVSKPSFALAQLFDDTSKKSLHYENANLEKLIHLNEYHIMTIQMFCFQSIRITKVLHFSIIPPRVKIYFEFSHYFWYMK